MPWVIAQSGGSYSIRDDVELVTVEVTALDKQGNPLPNLKIEDFQLYEDGKKQEILSFDEVSEALPINEGFLPRGKTVLIVLDCGNMTPLEITLSRDSAEKFVNKNMRPQDLFAVAFLGASMKIPQNFTGDRNEVLSAIEKYDGFEQNEMYLEDMLRVFEKIIYSMAPLRGQKSILIYGRQSLLLDRAPHEILWAIYRNALKSAKRSNTVFYTIVPNGLGFQSPSMYLSMLAYESGGHPIYDSESELDKFSRQISNYYILGFQSGNPKRDGGYRKLQVKTGLKEATLKCRDGYPDRRPVDVPAGSRQEKTLVAAPASSSAAAQLPVVFQPAYFYDSPGSARVLVEARIPMEKMSFRKKGDDLAADIYLMGIAYAEDGSVASRFSRTLPISFEKKKEPEFRKKGFPYRNYFKLHPGKYRLKLAILDESNNLGAMERQFEIPPLPEKGMAGSSIVIAERMSKLPELIQNIRAQLFEENNPLLCSGMQIEPLAENKLPSNSDIQVLFRLYKLSRASDLIAKPKLLNEKGETIFLEPILLNIIISPAAGGEGGIVLSLPFRGVTPGKYKLVIEVADVVSAEAATLQTDIEFVN
jgi:VWFA-related protein